MHINYHNKLCSLVCHGQFISCLKFDILINALISKKINGKVQSQIKLLQHNNCVNIQLIVSIGLKLQAGFQAK